MKKITLNTITPKAITKSDYIDRNKYKVFISSEHKFYFGSEVNAKRFLVKVSELLNTIVIEINFYYSEIFKEYRQSWTYIKNANDLSNQINSIEIKFNKLYDNKNSENYNFYVYNDLLNIILLVKRFLQELEDINYDNKIFNTVNRLRFYKNKLEELHEKLNTLKI